MKNVKKLLLILMTLAIAVSLFACGGDKCTHEDTDGNGICDLCEERLIDPVALIEDGEANFQIVLGEDVTVDVRLAANNLKTMLKKAGVTVSVVDYDEEPTDCEILIGTVTNRGEAYSFDRHTLGLEGYAVQIVGKKIIIAGGSDESLKSALNDFIDSVFSEDEEEMANLSVGVEVMVREVQSDYDITDIKIGGESIRGYTIATDIQNTLLYTPAITLRDAIYEEMGIWLDIVTLENATDKSVVITEVAKDATPNDSFRISVRGTVLYVEAEYANAVEKELAYYFNKNIISQEGEVTLEGTLYTKNVSVVTYEDFGAKGNGTTDDFAAMKAAHDYANLSGQLVKGGGPSKEYYICETRVNNRVQQIIVKTNVDWNGSKIVIDDTNISHIYDNRYDKNVFVFASDYPKILATSPQLNAVKDLINSGDGLGPQTEKLDLGLDYPAMLIIYNAGHRVYIRYGSNADNGELQHELVVVDKDGNIDPSTRLLLDYEDVTSIEIVRTDVEPITVKNAKIEKKMSRVDALLDDGTKRGTYIKRGLEINRSNITVENIEHIVTGEYTTEEWALGFGCQPYRGFYTVSEANHVLIKDCIMTAHHYYGIHGTYAMSVGESNDVTFKNCKQSNYYKADGVTISTANVNINGRGLDEYWGVGGSSYSKNMVFDGSMLTRFDAHAGLYNGKITGGSTVARIYIIGGGTMIIEDSTITTEGTLVLLRQDYGSTWKGDVIVRNCLVKPVKEATSTTTTLNLLAATWANHDFGYATYFPNLTIDNVTFLGLNRISYISKIGVDGSDFASATNFHEDMLKLPGRDPVKNENVYTPPAFAKIINNTGGYTVYYNPDIEFFKNTTFEGFTAE